jgi:DNA-binding MarR family transcriptional regulator
MARSEGQKSNANAAPETALDGLIGYNLKRAYMIAQADFRASLGRGGLGTRVFSALTLVVQSPNITQSALSRKLGIERSGLVAIIDELEACGFVRRMAVPGDRRVQSLSPTDDGIAMYAQTAKDVKDHEDILFSVLSEEEQRHLMALLKKIRNAYEGV